MLTVGNSKYSPAYAFSMRDAHRKPAQPVKAPAISWHLAFRKDTHFTFENQWIERIELLIIDIFSQLESEKKELQDEVNPTYISNLNGIDKHADRHQGDWTVSQVDLLRHAYTFGSKSTERVSPILPDGSRYETVVIETIWQGFPLHVRVEVFEEYFTLTSTLSLRHTLPNEALALPSACHNRILSVLSKNFPPNRPPSNKANERAMLEVSSDVAELYGGTWMRFNQNILSSCFGNRNESESQTYVTTELAELRELPLGEEIFADFRGMILGLDESDDWRTFRAAGPETETELALSRSRRVNCDHSAFHAKHGVDRAEQVLPILLAADGSPPRSTFENAEYTFSTFDHGRCLYGSSFGPQRVGKSSPLHYILVASHDDYRQLGTVTNRLHLMGTLRLAALLDFDSILGRHATLSNLDVEVGYVQSTDTPEKLVVRLHGVLEESIKALHELATELKDFDHKTVLKQSGAERYRSEFERHEAELTKIKQQHPSSDKTGAGFFAALNLNRSLLSDLQKSTRSLRAKLKDAVNPTSSQFRLVSPHERSEYRRIISSCGAIARSMALLLCSGDTIAYQKTLLSQIDHSLASMDERIRFGIGYRAERSKYSQERFRSLATAMSIAQVEGFQKYDMFVQQRLERSYSLMASIESRFNFIRSRVHTLEERYRSIDAINQSMKIAKLQLVAEIATLCFLVPYYLSELLTGTLKFIGTIERPELWIKPACWAICIIGYAIYYYRDHVAKRQVMRAALASKQADTTIEHHAHAVEG